MNSEVAPLLRARLQAYKKQINDAVDETRTFIVFAQVCLIIQEIDGLYHQHDKPMGYRRALDFAGCLSNECGIMVGNCTRALACCRSNGFYHRRMRTS